MAFELAELKPGDKVLDVGCGTGTMIIAAEAWAGPDGEVHGTMQHRISHAGQISLLTGQLNEEAK